MTARITSETLDLADGTLCARLTLAGGRANSLEPDLLRDLAAALDEAEAALEAAGLALGEFVGGGGNRTVVASDPPAGASVPRGSEVNLLLGR